MDIVLLKERDMDEARALWRMCFPEDTEDFIEQYFNARVDMNNAMGVLDEGKIVAIVHMIPYTLNIRGKRVFAPYVVGAGTHTAHRRKGLMGMLLIKALEEMHRRGAGASPLYPFRFSYYRHFGWDAVSARARLDIGAMALREAFAYVKGARLPPPDALRMNAIYQRFCARFGAYMARDEKECALRLQETQLSGSAVMLEDETGYALYEVNGGELSVHELCYTHAQALHGLLYGLAGLPGVERVRASMPVCDALPEALHDVKGCVSLEPFLMLRVADVAALLGGMDALCPDGILTLGVQDMHLPWNNAVFALETQQGRIVSVTKTDSCAQAEISAPALGQLVLGHITAGQALRDGLLRADAKTALGLTNFPAGSTPYFQEMY